MPPKKSTAKTGAGKTKPAPQTDGEPRIRVRMYRQGLGDCFLLSLRGGAHMLIDCGTIGATKPPSVEMDKVLADIAQETGGRLEAVIATHEHDDHVSGFRTHIDKLKELQVDESWQAWTEDANDPQARELEKYQGDLLHATAAAASQLSRLSDPALAGMGEATSELLSFNGVAGFGAAKAKEKSNEAMNNALRLGKKRSFLSPGTVLERPWAPGVRFYVLGPPRSESALHDMGRHGSPDLYDFAAALPGHDADFKARLPFYSLLSLSPDDPAVRARCARSYDEPSQAWRRIDSDWLGVAADFALQLDSYTNNTSLVLALEIDGRVLLFPGDAQLGSWLSWHTLSFEVKEGEKTRTVTAADLLNRTVFYKVGHHSSHNATATAKGLELMAGEDLVAFIPLDGVVAKNKKWPMPAAHLYTRLLEKARGRVVRSDVGWPGPAQRPQSVTQESWDQARQEARVREDPLYVEYSF